MPGLVKREGRKRGGHNPYEGRSVCYMLYRVTYRVAARLSWRENLSPLMFRQFLYRFSIALE
jgi:hypothetical protein